MNDDNRNERVNAGIDLESIYVAGEGVLRFDTTPVMFGADCCRRRLMRVLYPNRREDL